MSSATPIGYIFITFGTLFSLAFSIPFIRSFRTRYWRERTGRIYSSSIAKSYNVTDKEYSYKPVIRYQYTYEGKDYRSKKLGVLSQNLGGFHFSQKMVDKYKLGEAVPVYVNPTQPSEAVLIKGPEYIALPSIIIPQIFVLFGIFILFS